MAKNTGGTLWELAVQSKFKVISVHLSGLFRGS